MYKEIDDVCNKVQRKQKQHKKLHMIKTTLFILSTCQEQVRVLSNSLHPVSTSLIGIVMVNFMGHLDLSGALRLIITF